MDLVNEDFAKKKAHEALYDVFPKKYEGLVGVGKFRTTFHRIYEGGDGWMMGDKKVYIIVEVFNNVVKLSSYFNDMDDPKFHYHSTSGGSFPISSAVEELYESQIHDGEVTLSRQENNQPLTHR